MMHNKTLRARESMPASSTGLRLKGTVDTELGSQAVLAAWLPAGAVTKPATPSDPPRIFTRSFIHRIAHWPAVCFFNK